MAGSFLNIHHVSKTFDAVKALIDINLSIQKGMVHCLIGENGCGKSTLMKIISGVLQFDPLDESFIEIEGKRMENYSPSIAMYEGIHVIYQDLTLFPNLTIAENLATNERVSDKRAFINYKEMNQKAKQILEEVQLKADPYEYVENLSIAQQQLVAIGRAMTENLKLLIMDEPTSSLGKADVDHLIEVISSLKKRGITIVFIGHKLDEVMKIADNITVMRDGHIVKEIENMADVTEQNLEVYMTGKTEDEYEPYTFSPDKTKTPVLELDKFTKKGQFSDINLKLYKGEILGIIGLVGAGRTELMSTVFGLQKSDYGTIIIDGKLVSINNVRKAIDEGIALVPENRLAEGLFASKSIKENINVTTLDEHRTKIGFLDMKALETNSKYWVDTLKIKTPDQNNQATSLSGGNQQRIVLAKWLSTKPKILILDGPTVGIDIGAKAEIHKLIRELAINNQLAVIMITDEISEALKNASHIVVMRNGQFVLDKDRNEIDENQIRTALGIA
ncbi:MAG: sugar ABC transporter ATP-binding protein [Candidatus Cloacimonetes bacterium]|nr:sugar ABC transporter ATP-binding protein [Candidatus Cloacimonadota bacterium]